MVFSSKSIGSIKSLKRFKSFARIVEMGARDGIQNEKTIFPLHLKVEMINRLSATGLSKIEASSFVNPKLVPQFKDTAEVMAQITRKNTVKYTSLIPNIQGLKQAIEAKTDEIFVFGATNDVFSKRNINCTVEESFVRFRDVIDLAKQYNIPVRGGISCCFSCPFTGKTDPKRVAELAQRFVEMGCFEVALGDTNGAATPETVSEMLEKVLKVCDAQCLALHCHDTNGMSIANITRAIEMGIRVFDSSIGGIGGCPFGGPNITGNVATEKVVDLLRKLDLLEENIDPVEIHKVADWVRNVLLKPEAWPENQEIIKLENTIN